MSSDRRRRGETSEAEPTRASSAPAPGKQMRTRHLPVQRKATPSSGGLPFLDVMLRSGVQETAAAGVAGSNDALPHLDRIQASFGTAHDLSGVRSRVGGEARSAASAIGAEAYVTGDRAAFQHSPDLHTAAHEAAHVVQQRHGLTPDSGVGREREVLERQADAVADRVVQGASSADLLPAGGGGGGPASSVVQMRRVPGNAASLVDKDQDGDEPANVNAHRKGLRLVIERGEHALKLADANHGTVHFKNYMKEAMAGLAADEIVDPGELLVRKAEALRKLTPVLSLGDSELRVTGARRGTDDARNMRRLVRNATKVFDEIASGSRDTDVADVFGAAHVAAAKRNYARARSELRRIVSDDELLSDRSGFSDEVGLGGQAWYEGPIQLEPSAIDNPDDPESIRIVIHEAMHAGNPGIHDDGNYIGSGDAFKSEAAAVKLANAAHYEVVPRRILSLEPSFAGVVFVPASTAGVVTGPGAPLSAAMEAQRACATELRNAWARAIDIHEFVRRVRVEPRAWGRRLDQQRYSTVLRFWSRVLKLTIHEKTEIDVRSRDPAKLPVSDIDVALAEGIARRFRNAKNGLPGTETELADFEAARSTEAERVAAHASFETYRDFLKRLVMERPDVGPITGSLDRDMGVATELGTRTWEQVANPGAADDAADHDSPSAEAPHDHHQPMLDVPASG